MSPFPNPLMLLHKIKRICSMMNENSQWSNGLNFMYVKWMHCQPSQCNGCIMTMKCKSTKIWQNDLDALSRLDWQSDKMTTSTWSLEMSCLKNYLNFHWINIIQDLQECSWSRYRVTCPTPLRLFDHNRTNSSCKLWGRRFMNIGHYNCNLKKGKGC